MASHVDMDEDDIYPENDNYEPQESRMQDVDDEEEGEEVESDSEDDINFITDVREEPTVDATSQNNLRPGSQVNERNRQKLSPTPTPNIKRELTPQANIHRISTPQSDGRPGTDYPARHTSKLDPVNGNPVHPATGKPILETDLDTDFASESSKPWRKPGADITDYFNYGFDEFTWASYCLKKQNMPKEVKAINQETDQLKAFMDSMPGGGMPGIPPVPSGPAANVMPDISAMPGDMQQMMEFMKMQGMDPAMMQNMPPDQMMGMMMGMGPSMQPAQQPPTGPAGFSGGHQDNFSGRGRGRGRRW